MTPSRPLVSVLIPVRNGVATIAQTLDSVFRQRDARLQIVVVDNASDDGTVSLVRECFDRTPFECTFASCPERGANHARNLAFELANGDYIQWLDADDQLHERKIERQVTAMEQAPDRDIAVGDWIWRVMLPGPDPRRAAGLLRGLGIAAAWGTPGWRVAGRIAERRFVQPVHDAYLLRQLEDKWSPPHAYLLRHSAAQRLHEAAAWHPPAQVYQDREYFTAAALLGMRCLAVRDSWSRYNFWSSGQISVSADVYDRARALAAYTSRLERHARDIGGVHARLFRQDRGLWTLEPTALQDFARHAEAPLHRVVAQALGRNAGIACLERWTKVVTSTAKPLWERHSEVLDAVTALAQAGGLRREFGPVDDAKPDRARVR